MKLYQEIIYTIFSHQRKRWRIKINKNKTRVETYLEKKL